PRHRHTLRQACEKFPRRGSAGCRYNPPQLNTGPSTSREIDTAFSSFARERPDALFVGQAPFLASRRIQLITQAAHHRVPASYPGREYAEVGGLMTYGSDVRMPFV